MNGKIGLGLALDGEAEFKKGLRDVQLEIKLAEAQLKKISISYADNANSIKALTEKQEALTKQFEQQQKKVDLNRGQLETWQETNKKAATKVEDLKEELMDATKEMEDMEKATGTTKEEVEQQQKKIDELSKSLKAAEEAYDKSEGKVSKYRLGVENAEVGLAKLDAELKQNDKYLEEAKNTSDGLANSIDKYGNRVAEAKEKTKVFGDVLRANLVSEVILHGAEKLAQGIAKITESAVRVGSNFESSMSQVAATMGLTADEIEKGSEAYKTLEEAAEASGKTTKYTASQSAEALNYLALAGYDAKKAAETLPYVLDLASAGGLDLAYASDLVTDSMAALEIESSGLKNYIDQLAKTAQKSNTSIAQLGEGSLVAAGTASMTGQSIETLNAELGVLANRGIKAAEGGTHLRNILLRLVQPTQDGADALKDMGVDVADSEGNVRDLNDILSDLNKELSVMSAADKTNIIGTIFKVTDISAVNALLAGTGEEFDNLKNELLNCDNAAADMADTMNANLTGKVTILQSALEGLGITAYKRIEGTLKTSVDSATGAVGRLQSSMDNGKLGKAMDNFADSLGNAAEGAISFAEEALPAVIDGLTWVLDNTDMVVAGIAGITTTSIGMKTVVPAIEAVTTSWAAYKVETENATVANWLLNGAMSANPAVIIITGIVGLTAALATYTVLSDDAAKRTKELREENERMAEENQNLITQYQEKNESLKTQSATVDNLSKQLTELNDKESLSTEEKTKLKAIVDQLNAVMPDLNLTINEQTGYLNQSSEAIEKYIKKSKEMLLLEAAKENMAEIAKTLYEQESLLAEKEQELIEKKKELEAAQVAYNEACEEVGNLKYTSGGAEVLAEYKGDILAIRAEQELLEESVTQAGLAILETEEEYNKASQSAEKYSNSVEEVSKEMEAAEETQVTYKDQVYNVSEQVAASLSLVDEAYQTAKQEALDSINSQVGLFDELSTKSELSIKQMVENLKSQSEAYTSYTDNLIEANKIMEDDTTGTFSSIVGQISELGLAGAGYLNELVTAYYSNREDFDKVLSEWNAAETAKQALVETTADMKTEYSNTYDGVLGVQTEKNTQMESHSKALAAKQKAINKGAGIEMVNDAGTSMQSMSDSIKDGGKKVADESEVTADKSVKAVEDSWQITGGNSKSFETLGATAMFSMANGIKNNKTAAVNAAAAAAAEIFNAVQGNLQNGTVSVETTASAEKSVPVSTGAMTARLQTAMSELGEFALSAPNTNIIVQPANNQEIARLTRLVEEYLPECAKTKAVLPINQLSKDMSSMIDKDFSISAARKERYN